jgi:5,10-methylenetetrahydromethanopterin reductase
MLSPHLPIPDVVDSARLAESLGYTRVWVPDEGLATRDVFVTMTAIALATTRIEIGTGIVNPYTRHPAMTAAAIASVDEISGGRAFLALGAGGDLSLRPLALDRTRPVARVREAIEVSRRLFSGERVHYDGEGVIVRAASLDYARADTQIWFAGRGDQMLRQAGALADGVLLEFLYKPLLSSYVEQVQIGATRTGKRPRLCYSTVVVPDRSHYDSIRPHMTYRIVDSPTAVKAALGITPAQVDAIRLAMADGLAAAAPLIADDWIDAFVLIGTTDAVADELRALNSMHGFDEFLLVLADMHTAAEQITAFAPVATAI